MPALKPGCVEVGRDALQRRDPLVDTGEHFDLRLDSRLICALRQFATISCTPVTNHRRRHLAMELQGEDIAVHKGLSVAEAALKKGHGPFRHTEGLAVPMKCLEALGQSFEPHGIG